jgi:hypothetical protein
MSAAPKILIIAYVWPEPYSSAAGVRTEQVIEAARDAGWEVTLASAAKVHEAPQAHEEGQAQATRNVRTVSLELNHSSFDAWVRTEKFDFVVFDRFVTEEQFGWRIAEASPETIRILDTMDLHCLRRTRQSALAEGATLSDIFSGRVDFMNADAFREIASIYRCDLSLFVSDFEVELLREKFGVPPYLLEYAALGFPRTRAPDAPFEARAGFATIGNFRHPPNADGNRWLKNELWPLIRAALPSAQMHVYGAYPAKSDQALHDPSLGFYIEGPVPDSVVALSRHRVLLAPLRFGAGVKGKIADAWRAGLPVVTTPIGTEGMKNTQNQFGGLEAENAKDFAAASVRLLQDEREWNQLRQRGAETLEERFERATLNAKLVEKLSRLRANLGSHRNQNFTSRMLSQQAFRATKYFSKWLELKSPQGVSVNEARDDERVGAAP